MTDIQLTMTELRKDLDRARIGDRLFKIEDLLEGRGD